STPVDDSLCRTSTAFTSALVRSASATRSGATVSPWGAASSTTWSRYAFTMAIQRCANAPALTTMTRSPADSVLATAASIAPVPRRAHGAPERHHEDRVGARRARRQEAHDLVVVKREAARAEASGVRREVGAAAGKPGLEIDVPIAALAELGEHGLESREKEQ